MLSAEGHDLREVLNNLGADYPVFIEKILEPNGDMKPSVHVFLNTEDIRFLKGVETPLSDGDVVLILPAVAAG